MTLKYLKYKDIFLASLFINGEKGFEYSDHSLSKKISFEDLISIQKMINYEFRLTNNCLRVNRYDEFFCLEVEASILSEISDNKVKEINLTKVNYEILGIISQNIDVTRSEISKIRGVNSDNAIKKLIDTGFIKKTGVSIEKGGATTLGLDKEFFKFFNISNIDELPKIENISFDEIENDEISFLSQRFDKENNVNIEEIIDNGDDNGKNS